MLCLLLNTSQLLASVTFIFSFRLHSFEQKMVLEKTVNNFVVHLCDNCLLTLFAKKG